MNLTAPRATARVAWRNVSRQPGRSLLIALMVLLPVAAMVAAIAILRATEPTQEQLITSQMGRADLFAQVETEAELRTYLPAGSVVEPMDQLDGRLVLEGARPGVSLRAMALDGLAQGILTLVEGRAPHGAGEAAISRSVAELANVGIGGTVTLDGREPMTVVGYVENPRFLDDRAVVVDPAAGPVAVELRQFLVDLPDGADPDAIVAATYVPGTEVQQFGLQSRTTGLFGSSSDTYSSTILVFGALALLEASLIASAAFAVSIRRRQRELGLLAAAGATTRQLAGTVVAESAILGGAACIGGVVAGVLLAFGIHPFLDELTGHRNNPLVLDPTGILGPVAVGFGAALIAAITPARTVARLPVLRALSGRRPPELSARRTLVVGIAFVVLASAMTIGGASIRNGSGTVETILMMGGAVLGTLGFGACSPWLLERLGGLAARLPVAGRIAFRDTARARSRSSPIVTAILSGLGALIALGAWSASDDASELRFWKPSLYADQLVVYGAVPARVAADLLAEPGVVAAVPSTQLYPKDQSYSLTYELPGARHADGREINLYENCANCGGEVAPYQVSDVARGDPGLLAMAHAADAAADLQDGSIVLLSTEPITATTVVVKRFTGEGPDENLLTLPVRVVQVGVGSGFLPEAFLPDTAIATLGLVPFGDGFDSSYIVRYDHPYTEADLARAREIAGRYPDTVVDQGNVPPDIQGAGFRVLLIALVLLFALSVTGIAIALGEAESRPEQRTLLALGADPGLRRRIAASRAAILALLAGLLSIPAGLLPVWGVFASRDRPLAIPTMEIAAAVVALPLLAIGFALFLSRPIPDWSAFRNVRPGE